MGKHIAFLILNFSNGGGTERVTSVISNNLFKRGYTVSVISCREGEKNCFFIEKDIALYSLHGERISNTVLRKLHTVRELQKLVIQHGIDILVAVDVALYLYLWPLQKKQLCKCIAWEHFNYYICPNKLVRYSRKLAAEHADCVVVLGKNDLNNYLTHYKNTKNVKYIYNPITVDTSEHSPLTNKRAIAVGRLSRQKGFDMLIEAWSLIEKEVPDWKLDIYGQGPLHDQLQQQIDRLNLKNIQLKGFSGNIHKEYMESSLFLLTSRYEGFVLVLMEAMATGLPSVSFRCKEGPEETIEDGINGYLVEEGNVQQFADRAVRLMKDRDLLCQFSSQTAKDLHRFSIPSVMQQWEELLNNI